MVAALVSRNLSSCISQVLQLQSWSMRGCVGTVWTGQKVRILSKKMGFNVCLYICVGSLVFVFGQCCDAGRT